MGGRRDYTRWDYDDETEITLEEQLTLEENPDSSSLAGGVENSTATFPPPNVMSSSSPIRISRDSCKRSRKTSIKEKAQLFALSAGVLLVGFIAGFGIGVRDRGTQITSRHSKHFSSINDPQQQLHEHNDQILHELLHQINAENIRNNLKRMTQEEHRAGTKEGRSMAIAIRDLWRSYGISVRLEQQKTLLTKTDSFNFVEVLSNNGSVLFTTSKIGDDANLPNSHPIIAFSPSADFNGTLVYGRYGRFEDFQTLKKSQITLKGSIALVRFGSIHPSNVANIALGFGIRGLIFYPDPEDFGTQLPKTAIRRSSLLTVGQVHDFQKKKGNGSIPSHTISSKDAEMLFSNAMAGTEKAPRDWTGGLKTMYYLGGRKPDGEGLIRLKIFNEAKKSDIYNVVAAIPGAFESDRYVIIGCSHDSWGRGAADPGIGLAMTTELLRAFSASLNTGWRPRRSILIISWDANLFSSSGVTHWLQEHHFEISTRAIAYIDMTRVLQGNQTLDVFSSPLLKEVARKAINRIKHSTETTGTKTSTSDEGKTLSKTTGFPNVQWKAAVSKDEPSMAFMGTLGIPFIRFCASNTPKGYNYPMFHTAFDTYDNFVTLVDPQFKQAEALDQIIAEVVLLLADSSALPITLHDYIRDIRKEFDHFMAEYHDDFRRANLSYAQFQAALTRLEVTADNFKFQTKNHTAKDNGHNFAQHHRKLRREMNHRILNDKLISVEKALLARNSESNDGYKHQVIGYISSNMIPEIPPSTLGKVMKPQESSQLVNKSNSLVNTTVENSTKSSSSGKKSSFHSHHRAFSQDQFPSSPHFFPKLRSVLDCGRSCEDKLSNGDACTDFYLSSTMNQGISSEASENSDGKIGSVGSSISGNSSNSCFDWRASAAQKISSLVRSLDSVSAILQSPLVTTHE